jgi:hypothetical protein
LQHGANELMKTENQNKDGKKWRKKAGKNSTVIFD